VLSGVFDAPQDGCGRIVREDGRFARIVEERDCTPAQRALCEVNSGVFAFRSSVLFGALESLTNANAQGEYYLTDAPEILLRGGSVVSVCARNLGDEMLGVNTPEQLRRVEEILRGA
jgi:bifunctional UDP-N-acetylglucosamine pyrophosphorylase/glucosamine-1-phosphate N-acetyltransferase